MQICRTIVLSHASSVFAFPFVPIVILHEALFAADFKYFNINSFKLRAIVRYLRKSVVLITKKVL